MAETLKVAGKHMLRAALLFVVFEILRRAIVANIEKPEIWVLVLCGVVLLVLASMVPSAARDIRNEIDRLAKLHK